MVVYVVVGASRGLGYEFLRQLSQDSNNTVFGLARNKVAVEKQLAEDGLNNVHIISAEITDRASLQAAKAEIEKSTSVVDVLIHNAAIMPVRTYYGGLSYHEKTPEAFDEDMTAIFETNTIAVVKTINVFLPLIKKSSIKKVIALSTGLADDNLTNNFEIPDGAIYSMSKAALNTAIAKYNAQHGKSSDGILFLAISPGLVDTGNSAARKSYSLLFYLKLTVRNSSARFWYAIEVSEGISQLQRTNHAWRISQGYDIRC